MGTLRPHGTGKISRRARVVLISKSSQSLIRSGPTSAWYTNGSCSSFRRKVNVKGGGQECPPQGQGWPKTARARSPLQFPFPAGIGSFGRDDKSLYAASAAAACHTGLAGVGWRAPRVRPVFRGGNRTTFFPMASARASARWYLTSRIRRSSRSIWHRGPWSRISAPISVSSCQSCHSPIASFTSPSLVMNSY